MSASLTMREALSGMASSISLASWVFVLLPQFVENLKNGNAEGLSLIFLSIWLLGDAASLIGAIWAGLLPTVIALAIYFCFADLVLILQKLYYSHVKPAVAGAQPRRESFSTDTDDPTAPLLSVRRASIAGSTRRRDSSSAVLEKQSSGAGLSRDFLALAALFLLGVLGWFVAWKTGVWSIPDGDDGDQSGTPWGASFLGYLSAVLYLGARIPQIIRNHQKKSCEGLSLLFFMLSLVGNLTYGAGIIFHSTESSYILRNLPWLIGSLGTVLEDVIIFTQFHMYSEFALEVEPITFPVLDI